MKEFLEILTEKKENTIYDDFAKFERLANDALSEASRKIDKASKKIEKDAGKGHKGTFNNLFYNWLEKKQKEDGLLRDLLIGNL